MLEVRDKGKILTVIYCVFIFWLSHQSDLSWLGGVTTTITFRLKAVMFIKHVIEFLILGVLLQYSLLNFRLTIVYGFGYSIFDEIHQWFIPNRVFSLIDILADFLGIILGVIICIIVLVIAVTKNDESPSRWPEL